MPEQPQWSERTLDMPPQDPWADPPTTDMGGRGQQRPGPARPGGPAGPGLNKTQVWDANSGSAAVRPSSAPPVSGPPSQGPANQPVSPPSPFSSGRASVTPRAPQQQAAEHEPTGTGWPEHHDQHRPSRSLSWHIEQLRRGGEWSFAGLLFAFVCWGIWAISEGGDLVTPVLIFVISVLVAAGVFALSRLIGRVVLERQFGRQRHTARGSHMVAGVFLVGVGIAHLQQTGWVMTAVNWVTSTF